MTTLSPYQRHVYSRRQTETPENGGGVASVQRAVRDLSPFGVNALANVLADADREAEAARLDGRPMTWGADLDEDIREWVSPSIADDLNDQHGDLRDITDPYSAAANSIRSQIQRAVS